MNNNQPAETVEAPRQYRVPFHQLDLLREKLAKINAKAAKLGASPVVLVEGEPVIYVLEVGLGGEAWVKVGNAKDLENAKFVGPSRTIVPCSLTGEAPKLAGHSLVAVIEHLGEDGNLIRQVPSSTVQLAAEYRESRPTCDHCKLLRSRTETFVLQHESGVLRRVGRNCLSDFLGGQDPQVLLAGFDAFDRALFVLGEHEDREEGLGGYGGGGVRELPLVGYLSYVAACIRHLGWTSAKASREIGGAKTADVAVKLIVSGGGQDLKDVIPTDEDRQLASEAVVYARSLKDSGKELSDYEHNLAVVCAHPVFELPHAGLVASLITGYQRHLNLVAERARVANLLANSAHVGAVGERHDFTVTVLKTVELQSAFGRKVLFSLVDAQGNSLNWFATGAGCDSLKLGKSYSVKATVSGHNEYKGVKQTIVKRLAINPSTAELDAVAAEKAMVKLAEKELKELKKPLTDAAKAQKAVKLELQKAAPGSELQYQLSADLQQARSVTQQASFTYYKAVQAKVAELRAAKQAA